MNKYEPTRQQLSNGAVWHTIVFKASTFHFSGQKLDNMTPLWKFLSSIPIQLKNRGSSNTYLYVCSQCVYMYTVST